MKMKNLLLQKNTLKIGTYCFPEACWTDAHVKAVKDCGIDFITTCADNPRLLTLLEKHRLGAIVSFYPGWWGGINYNSGLLHKTNTVEKYEEMAPTFVDSPAVWAMDLGDEPNALDFPQFRKLADASRRLFPDKLPYINLHPMSLNRLTNLGTARYSAYTERFIKELDFLYVSFDNYMYDWGVGNFYEQIRTVAEKCRAYGREMWVVVQVNSEQPEYSMRVEQLRHQASLCMSFGATVINWACWAGGWWCNKVSDDNGNIGPQYARLQKVNREIRAVAPIYNKYATQEVKFVTATHPVHLAFNQQDSDKMVTLGNFFDVTAATPGFVTVGYMKKRRGRGEALMITDSSNPSGLPSLGVPGGYDLSFGIADTARSYTLHGWKNGQPFDVPVQDGRAHLRVGNCDSILITLEPLV